jgi:patatin-like phospholipase/acyl hydrolase
MPLKILSIDGGGTRGLIPATILHCIEKEFGKSPVELFDLFAGTSTGGIISIALAAGLPASALVDLYLNKSKDIFWEPLPDRMQGMDEHLQDNYGNKRFRKILQDLFGEKTLGDIHKDKKFGGRNKKLMVCSFDLSPEEEGDRNKNWRPAVFHSSFKKCKGVKLVDLALMTSAGPTYFPVHLNHIDGGVAMNNPSMAAISFAINKHVSSGTDYMYPDGKRKGLGLDLGELQLFSLSTGTGNKNRIDKSQIKTGNWGSLQWIKYLPDLLTESNMQSTWYYVQQVLTDEQRLRIELFFDDPKAPRILQEKPVGLDATKKEILEAMHAFAILTYETEKESIRKFLGL